LNPELFIAKHLFSTGKDSAPMSKPVIRLAVLAIALSLAVMIIAVSVLTGFQTEIRDKVIGFGSHIQITNYDSNTSLEPNPIKKQQPFLNELKNIPGIRHVQVFGTKAGIIKTETEIEGVVLKGIGSDFDWNFFENKILEGKHITVTDTGKTNGILISKQIAQKLNLKTGDNLLMYFIHQPLRARKFNVEGIYQTGLEEFDSKFVLGDIGHIQKLNDWDSSEVAGFEVLIDDFDELEKLGNEVYSTVGYNLNAATIKEIYPQIFDWLNLTNMNVRVILILMVIVAVINMTTALLILILERTNMIGILKALGASNWLIRKIFLVNAAYLILKGLLWGNIAGILLCWLQLQFGIIKLDQASYYVSLVPIEFNFGFIILLNIATFLICLCVLVLPSYIVTRITPVKAIRFS